MLDARNPDGRSNRDVVRPWVNGLRHHRPTSAACGSSTSGPHMAREEAALYEAPFEHVAAARASRSAIRSGGRLRRALVAPRASRRPGCGRRWHGLHRYIATPRTAKHRLFVWLTRRYARRPRARRHRARRRLHLRRAPLARPRALGARAWARSCERTSPASATRRRRRSRRSPSRDPSDEQREAIAAAAQAPGRAAQRLARPARRQRGGAQACAP